MIYHKQKRGRRDFWSRKKNGSSDWPGGRRLLGYYVEMSLQGWRKNNQGGGYQSDTGEDDDRSGSIRVVRNGWIWDIF